VLPCEVRVISLRHPLFGQVLAANHFKRVDGVVFLVVTLPDGSPGTIRADATDVCGEADPELVAVVLDGDGLRTLFAMVTGLRARGGGPVVAGDDK
jgi:hypothetical protein